MAEQKMVLILTDEGKFHLESTMPLENKIFCYGLLELAKDVVRSVKVEEKKIMPASGISIVPFPRKS